MSGTMIALRKTQKALKQLHEGHRQWETHWEFLHAWLEEIADGYISGNDVLKVMDELRRGNDNES